MPDLTLALYAIPLILALGGLAALGVPGPRPHAALSASRYATLGTLALAVGAGAALLAGGAASSPVLGAGGFGFQVRLDALSAVLVLLVTFLGAVVVQFSRNYLDGDDRQGPFLGYLCLTLASVTLLVLAGNIAQVFVAWVLIGIFVDRLLLFYGDRPRARIAAKKKRVFSALGAFALLVAVALLGIAFGTGDIAAIAAAAPEAPRSLIVPAALLLVLAALLKCAAFPAHGWLVEVMETPTPVSALLHAGVVNAGGFLVIRFADLLTTVPFALDALALLGGIAAAVGSLAMITQTSVKVSLAWSTVAQMGFMLLQCGFGAFTSATLHIVAHSLYKAHAFLTSGSVIDLARAKPAAAAAEPTGAQTAAALALSAAAVLVTGWAFGFTFETKPAIVSFGLVLLLGLAHFSAARLSADVAALPATAGAVVGVAALYFALQIGSEHLLGSAMPLSAPVDPLGAALLAGSVAVFAGIAVLQARRTALAATPAGRTLHLLFRNGFYADAVLARILGRTIAA